VWVAAHADSRCQMTHAVVVVFRCSHVLLSFKQGQLQQSLIGGNVGPSALLSCIEQHACCLAAMPHSATVGVQHIMAHP
jgi:hypothetical protein